jgi:WXG100 family type VII secretion target
MGGSFNTETETMLQASRHVSDVNEQIGSQLRTLGSQLAPLEGAWRGSASTAFQQLIVRFNENAEKLRAALQGISEQVAGASTTYATEDEAQQQAMSRITSALG